MPTMHVPPLLRQLWAIIVAVLASLFAVAVLTQLHAIEAPPLIVPIAVLAIAATVGFAYRDQLLSTPTRALFTILGLAALLLAFQLAPSALAQEASDAANGVVKPTESTVITIDALTLSFLVGSVMPLLTALATKLKASPTVKGVVNLVLSVAGGVLAAFVTNKGTLTIQEIAAAAIATYLSAQALYSGVLRAPAAAIAKAKPGGIG